ncbi:MAG: phenylalanine--tRNA ligase subunit alpha [Verrucomicrobiota bacterium]|nr:phenylalanine--tRNA ligase subunit alpha [Verrucomicrobiota bacterium]
MREEIEQLRTFFLKELQETGTSLELEQLKVKYLGKKGSVQALLQGLKGASPEERPQIGKWVNSLKEEIEAHCVNTLARLQRAEMFAAFEKEWIDPTLPGRRPWVGRAHPLTQMLHRVVEILVGMGFSVRLGPDVETDYYNFEGLNFPPDHPARDMQDTFYLGEGLLLRTHTSNVQVRVMEREKPPLRVVAPGRAFRNEDVSSRSHIFFHQVEGFSLDRNLTCVDLLATLRTFLHRFLGEECKMRVRPSYFPFVEPGMEIDMECRRCAGKGCRLCKESGWLEVLGAGMIHPNVLKNCGVDPEVFSGYAWGMGIERLAMLHYDISDIRLFTENDMRFLEQFSGV